MGASSTQVEEARRNRDENGHPLGGARPRPRIAGHVRAFRCMRYVCALQVEGCRGEASHGGGFWQRRAQGRKVRPGQRSLQVRWPQAGRLSAVVNAGAAQAAAQGGAHVTVLEPLRSARSARRRSVNRATPPATSALGRGRREGGIATPEGRLAQEVCVRNAEGRRVQHTGRPQLKTRRARRVPRKA